MRRLDSVANPPVVHSRALQFETEELDAGTLCEDDSPSIYRFRFTNRGTEPLVILRAVTSCGCIEADFCREPVLPGYEGEICVSFDPKDQAGALLRHVYLYTNRSKSHPSARLTLRGEVLPTCDPWNDYSRRLGSSLRARRCGVVVRQLSRTQALSERIECVNTGSEPLRFVADKGTPPWITLRTDPDPLEPGIPGDLVVTVDGRMIPDSIAPKWRHVLWITTLPGGEMLQSIVVEAELID